MHGCEADRGGCPQADHGEAQLSIVMNGKAMDAAREADEKLAELRECEARQADKVAWFTEHKLKSASYARAEARERLYTRQANEVDTLLASLLGKLSLNITETSTVKR
jgi:poly-gamma-glutamate capsule biosynthesis protein CapA/YwtB (metallophosphatase superfamily)